MSTTPTPATTPAPTATTLPLDQTTVAFVGLGHMGAPMAANLVRAGVRVIGFDLMPAALDAARAAGAEIAESGAAAAAQADIVLTMLPSGQHVLSAYADGADGSPGLLSSAKPGSLMLDCSTISVAEAQQAAQLANAVGHRSADAPVSGGVVGAEAGSLAFMVGAPEDVFADVYPILDVMGGRIVHCGANGLGQAAKVCNNMILAVSQIAVAEAFVLGEGLGLTHQALFDVASNATGQCWALNTNCPVPGPVPTSPANRDYQPGFAGALMAKDLGLALAAIEQTGTQADLGRHAEEIYRRFRDEDGGAGTDFSGIINVIREKSDHS
ncbi:3-hydroxyisobutyrate dehydrogenase [Galactobacter caseinivorans]|uniref:3-hydroxyisobutyrate dehydrogenase n=1 Tax=Galactobacter caseinivorans TaxID=2676123 RepID=A0A496PHH2_9MICC|nr:3-hydroxyisobutyrate dehydrogenase [Galactobacter caseinivorans]RKW69919.1 3-hydroxyisobutyrate dehydrogenase [Galactobacter caseinivorans]